VPPVSIESRRGRALIIGKKNIRKTLTGEVNFGIKIGIRIMIYEQVTREIKRCLQTESEHFGIELKSMPTVLYDLKGHTAGKAFIYENKLRLNRGLLLKYKEDFIKRTVTHEMGHLIATRQHGSCGHGPFWKNVMRILGGPTSRCHSYKTTPARVHKKIKMVCQSCGTTVSVGAIIANKIRKGSTYLHRCARGLKGTIKIA
jgi:SprT protein